MLTQAITGAFDVDDDGMVKQSVEESSCDHGISEHLTPFGEAAIGGKDHSAALITGVDQLEEQVAGGSAEAEIADFIDDEQRSATEESDTLAQTALTISFSERIDDIDEWGEVDAAASTDGFDTKRGGEMGLPVPDWPMKCTTSCWSIKSS
jgi:hypothetical protein